MARSYEHLLGFALTSPWALDPAMTTIVANIIVRHVAGDPPDEDAIAAALEARSAYDERRHGGVASASGDGVTVIPIHGVVAPRMNLLSNVSGGTTCEELTGQLRAAVADPRTTRIVLDCDSPGGSCSGIPELARAVRDARAVKPVTAVANHLMASACYWIASQATQVIASPSAMVGSVGVINIYNDVSAALEKAGVKRELIVAGRFKGEASGGALSPEARAHMQSVVDAMFGRFARDVGLGRRVPVATVKSDFGEGRLLDADAALAAGLVDHLSTLDEVLNGVASPVTTTVDPHRQAAARAAIGLRHAMVMARAPHLTLT